MVRSSSSSSAFVVVVYTIFIFDHKFCCHCSSAVGGVMCNVVCVRFLFFE